MKKYYQNILTKERVEIEEAYEYAVTKTFSSIEDFKEFLNVFCFHYNPEEDVKNLFITQDKKLQEEFTEWFFSGNWILYEEKEEENY